MGIITQKGIGFKQLWEGLVSLGKSVELSISIGWSEESNGRAQSDRP